MSKVFAPQYKREGDLILFPRDVKWRKQLFPDKVFEHPAKANMYLIEELIKYLTEPGDTIVDPFAGTGTLLIGALMGRNIALIDVEPTFINLLEETQKKWEESAVGPQEGRQPGKIFVYEGDCRQKLKDLDYLCDASIFSPPYSNLLTGSTGLQQNIGRSARAGALSQYTGKDASTLNMGRLNPFYFTQAMNLVYRRLATRLVKGAPVALITKDSMKAGTREFLSEGIIRQAGKCGLEFVEWFKWKPPGSAQRRIQESRGAEVVKDEDILLFRRRE